MEKITIRQNLNMATKIKLASLKSRLCGYLAGDGYVSILRGKHIYYEVNFYPDDYSMLLSFVEAFRIVYGKEPLIYRYKGRPLFYVRCRNKIICNDLLSIGKFKGLEWRVPFKLLKDDESKTEWLRAFFDCEAHVAKKQIQLQSVNLYGLLQIRELLKSFSIESKMYKYERENKNWNTNYILSIMKLESRKAYLGTIGFNHKEKRERLGSYIKNAEVGQSGSPLVSN